MCNELPLRKEEMVVFIWYIGNKDTSALNLKSLRVNRKNVLEALFWLKKHNPFYANVSVREDNLDWMQGEEKVSIATNAMKCETKNSKQFKIIAGESEYVSSAHITQLDTSKNNTDYYNQDKDSSDCADLDIMTMHAN
jgi:hypothetical protein